LLAERESHLKRLAGPAAIASVGILVVALSYGFVENLPKADKHDLRAPDEYATDLLMSLPQDAIFVAGEDNSFLPLLAKQGIAGVRTDVCVVSGGALLRRDYREKLQLRHPQLWYPDNWLKTDFAADFVTNLHQWLKQNDAEHPVYLTLSDWTAGLLPRLLPHQLAYSLEPLQSVTKSAVLAAAGEHQHVSSWWQGVNDLTSREHFGRLLLNRAVYLYRHDCHRQAVATASLAASTDPGNVDLLVNCFKLAFAGGDLPVAERMTKAIVKLDPDNPIIGQPLRAPGQLAQEADNEQ
jgi:hypothetical protein